MADIRDFIWGQQIYMTEEEVRGIGAYQPTIFGQCISKYSFKVWDTCFLICTFFYIFLVREMIIQKRNILVIILFVYALYGTMENGLYMMAHNIFLIAFADLLYQKMGNKELEK